MVISWNHSSLLLLLDLSLPVATEAPPLVILDFVLLLLLIAFAFALAVHALLFLPIASDQVHLVDVHRSSSPRRSFGEAAIDGIVFDTGEAVRSCSGPQQVLPKLGILQVLVHDCDLEIFGYLFVRECHVQPALLLEHIKGDVVFGD